MMLTPDPFKKIIYFNYLNNGKKYLNFSCFSETLFSKKLNNLFLSNV